MSNQRLKKGDQVLVTTGKDKGKTGIITKIYADKNRVLITGINMIKKTVKRNPQTDEPGKIIEQEASIHISNVMFFDKSGKPTRKRPSA